MNLIKIILNISDICFFLWFHLFTIFNKKKKIIIINKFVINFNTSYFYLIINSIILSYRSLKLINISQSFDKYFYTIDLISETIASKN